MKCPKAIAWQWELGHKPQFSYGDCLKEECAWWDENSAACAIWAIMSALDALGKLFREIEQKIPHKA